MDDQWLHDRWGANLKAARLAAGLTQVQISERAVVTQTVYSRYESGKVVPSDGMKLRLAEVLNLEPDALFGWPTLDELCAS